MTSRKHKQKRTLHFCKVLLGAANQIRTGDLVLTKDVLCLLSHSSISDLFLWVIADCLFIISIRLPDVNTFFESFSAFFVASAKTASLRAFSGGLSGMFFFIPGVSREFSKNNFPRFLKIFFRAVSLPSPSCPGSPPAKQPAPGPPGVIPCVFIFSRQKIPHTFPAGRIGWSKPLNRRF